MTKLSKFIYIAMAIIGITTFVTRLITKEYHRAGDEFALLCWVGVAFMNELRCIKLQKQIDESNGNY
jgi:hypothetical protein